MNLAKPFGQSLPSKPIMLSALQSKTKKVRRYNALMSSGFWLDKVFLGTYNPHQHTRQAYGSRSYAQIVRVFYVYHLPKQK